MTLLIRIIIWENQYNSHSQQLGRFCLLYKRDVLRYFRQIPVCPMDYSLLGWRWRNFLYFDTKMPMGLQSVVYISQRLSTAMAYIHHQMEYFSINYIDDYGSVEPSHLAWDSYQTLGNIFQQIGLDEAKHKAVPQPLGLNSLEPF